MLTIAFVVFLLVVQQVLTWLYYRHKVDGRALDLFDDWKNGQHEETEVLWGYVMGANKRRKTVDRILERERKRHSRTAADAVKVLQEREELQARVNWLEIEADEARARYRSLAAETIEQLVKKETKKVVEGLMRKIAKDESED